MRNDLGIYDRAGDDWWRVDSRFAASLHAINAHRLAHVRARYGIRLGGLTVVDLGCGGGLMAEPLARAGARVIGIDISLASLRVARAHARGGPAPGYARGDARQPPLMDGCADLVLLADVIEHVDGWTKALAAAARLLRSGGACYLNTVNRTRRSRWLAVGLAEGLCFVPKGTHDPARFVTPEEVASAADGVGLRVEAWLGQRLNLWQTLRTHAIHVADGPSLALGYGAWLVKAETNAAEPQPSCIIG